MTIAHDLIAETVANIVDRDSSRIALLGLTADALTVSTALQALGLGDRVVGVFDPAFPQGRPILLRPWKEVVDPPPDLVVVCSDEAKEPLLRAFCDVAGGSRVDVIIAGAAHLSFRDAVYDALDEPALVPSYATGYANTRVHLYQCLKAAAANGLSGAVVEFGAFKGGTTAWLARTTRRLGLNSRVIGFDSWSGFPPRRSPLDMYTHPRCVYRDVDAVRAHVAPLGIELVPGDIVDTAVDALRDVPVLLAFVDTDNYSPAKAALEAVLPNLVPGGAIVFDHYETTPDYLYTLGERMAADEVLAGAGLLHLHGTGVFVRLACA